MHNLHIVVTPADNAENALDTVNNFISDFGNENNYYQVFGAIGENNEVYIDDPNAKDQKKLWGLGSIEEVNAYLKEILKGPFWVEEDALKIMQNILSNNNSISNDYYKLKIYAEHKYQTSYIKDIENFNVFNDSFYEFQYDEVGVTHTGYKQEEGQLLYAVFIDMHS